MKRFFLKLKNYIVERFLIVLNIIAFLLFIVLLIYFVFKVGLDFSMPLVVILFVGAIAIWCAAITWLIILIVICGIAAIIRAIVASRKNTFFNSESNNGKLK